MSFFGSFRKSKPDLRVAIDVGSHSIKALVFHAPKTPALPKIIKKLAVKLPAAYDPKRTALKFREFLFFIVKDLGRVPGRITAAFEPSLAGHTLATWIFRPGGGKPRPLIAEYYNTRQNSAGDGPAPRAQDIPKERGKIVSRENIAAYFQNLFAEHSDPGRALLAYPLGLLVNGYPVAKIRKQKLEGVKEIGFRTLLLNFPDEAGMILAEAKESLGGLPLEFIPLAVVFKEAAAGSLGITDALFVNVGGEETTLTFLREREITHIGSFSFGTRRFLRGISKIASVSLEEAEDVKRRYAPGSAGEAKKAELRDFLRQEAGFWKKMFLAELEAAYHLGPLSPLVFLLGEGANLAEIGEALRSRDWFGNFSYAASPQVRILTAEGIFGGNTLGGFLQGPEETGLASLVIYSTCHEPVF